MTSIRSVLWQTALAASFMAVAFLAIPLPASAQTTGPSIVAIPPGKTMQRQDCAANNPTGDPPFLLHVSTSLVRESGGNCDIYLTDGTRLKVVFDETNQTVTVRTYGANNQPLTPESAPVSWAEAAAAAAAQAQAIAAANPNNRQAQANASTSAADAQVAQADQTRVAAEVAEAHSQCNIPGNIWPCVGDLVYEVVKRVALFFLWLAAFFLGLVGIIFNWTIYITVFQFGNLIGNNPGMLAAWGILRDIGNILLLFGFIFMGISTILNLPGNEFTAKRALPTLIIFAILMNFSLFAAEAIIDTSNALGSTLYRQAGNGLCTDASDLYRCATESGIAGAIMQITGITTIFNPADGITVFTDSNVQNALIMIGLTIFVATLAMVLLAATIMLSIRAVTLAFLMAVSPIGFAGMAVPILHKFAKMWWDQLLKQAFYAPVYILMVLVAVKFVDGMRVSLGSETTTLASAISSGGISNVSIVIMFILMVGFLLAATQTAKDMSAIGSSAATKMAGAVVFGGMARVSNTVTNGAARVARTSLQRSPIGNTGFSRFVTNNMLRPIENANTDIRNWAVPGMGAISKVAGGPAEHATLGDMQHQIQDVKQKVNAANQQYNKEVSMATLAKEVKEVSAGKRTQISDESEKFLAGLTAEQIASDHALLHAVEGVAERLSPEQFEGLMKSDKVAAKEKNDIAQHRFAAANAIGSAAGNITDAEQTAIKKISNKELEMMAKYDATGFKRLMSRTNDKGETLTSDTQNDALASSQSLTQTQRDHVSNSTRRGKVDAAVATISNPNSTPQDVAKAQQALPAYAKGLSAKQKVKLSKETLMNSQVTRTLTSDDFREFMREGKLQDAGDRKRLWAAAANPLTRTSADLQDLQKYVGSDTRAAAYWT